MAKKKASKKPVKKVSAPKIAEKTTEALLMEMTPPAAAPEMAPVMEQAPIMEVQPAPTPAKKASRSAVSIGIWAYFIGIIVSFAAVLYLDPSLTYYLYAALAILGFLVGLLNITDDEIMLFLVASIAFVVSSYSVREVLSASPGVNQFFANIIVFTAASAFIVSIKALIRVAREK